ncbi:unnamed protein product, partial [Urochloa humidicola]
MMTGPWKSGLMRRGWYFASMIICLVIGIAHLCKQQIGDWGRGIMDRKKRLGLPESVSCYHSSVGKGMYRCMLCILLVIMYVLRIIHLFSLDMMAINRRLILLCY